MLLGHILIAAGVLPGYRGVWRSMPLGGHLDAEVARRTWPAWLERTTETKKADQPVPPGSTGSATDNH